MEEKNISLINSSIISFLMYAHKYSFIILASHIAKVNKINYIFSYVIIPVIIVLIFNFINLFPTIIANNNVKIKSFLSIIFFCISMFLTIQKDILYFWLGIFFAGISFKLIYEFVSYYLDSAYFEKQKYAGSVFGLLAYVIYSDFNLYRIAIIYSLCYILPILFFSIDFDTGIIKNQSYFADNENNVSQNNSSFLNTLPEFIFLIINEFLICLGYLFIQKINLLKIDNYENMIVCLLIVNIISSLYGYVFYKSLKMEEYNNNKKVNIKKRIFFILTALSQIAISSLYLLNLNANRTNVFFFVILGFIEFFKYFLYQYRNFSKVNISKTININYYDFSKLIGQLLLVIYFVTCNNLLMNFEKIFFLKYILITITLLNIFSLILRLFVNK